MVKQKNFSNPKQLRPRTNASFVLALCLFSIFIGVTLAFFFADNFATKDVTLSGAVNIEAVGPGPSYNSIEDTVSETKLIVTLEDNYDRLIPGMKINIPANCKVYKSTTKPLLRAMLDMRMYETDLTTASDDTWISANLYNQLIEKVEANGWYLHTDGYYYYVGDIIQDEDELLGDSELKEVDATSNNVVVDFIKESDIIIFPKTIDSSYSAMGVKIVITFQAIQNYIPNDAGEKLANTIDNSLKLFNYIESSKLTPAPLEYFNVSTVAGKSTLSLKPETLNLLPEMVVLPSEDAEGNPITALDNTFAGDCGKITKLIVPSSYTTIAEGAFKSTTIETVDLSNTTITNVPSQAFSGSEVKNVILPTTVTTLSSQAFHNSTLTSIVIPEGVTRLESTSLWSTKLTSIYIPSTVEYIADQTIYSPKLKKIVVHEDNPYFFDVDDSLLVGTNGTLYSTVVDLPEYVMIPDEVTYLTPYSMYLCSKIKTLNLNNVSNIANNALTPSIISFVIPEYNSNYDTSVGYDLIQKSNNKLIKVCPQVNKFDYSIPDVVELMSEGCFGNCVIGTLKIGRNCRSWTILANNFSIDYIDVDENNSVFMTNQNNTALYTDDIFTFYSSTCADLQYDVPNGITIIDYFAFSTNKNIETINLPQGLLTIRNQAFSNCTNLKNLNMVDSITNIKSYIISGTQIANINLYGILEESVMRNCVHVKTITMGSTVSSIGANAFSGCIALDWIEFKSTTPPTFATSNMFSGASSDWVIYVPSSAVATYKAVPQLAPYADRIFSVTERP